MKMCLGTVQFGMEYGVNNTHGQPTLDQSLEMLQTALELGIRTFDTAAAYGNAEEILGHFLKTIDVSTYGNIKIVSKLRPNCIVEGISAKKQVYSECESSLKRLRVDYLDGYLLHTPEYIYRKDVIEALGDLKNEGIVKNIGVSVYELKEGYAGIESGIVDYIQLPYSVIDQRGSISGFFRLAKQEGVSIFTRSAFLQGLFMMKRDSIPEYLNNAIPYLRQFDEIIKKYNVDMVTALIQFVKQEEGIDYLVWGVDNKEQLINDIHAFNSGSVPKEMIKEIKDRIGCVDRGIIIPSLWAGGKKAE